MAALTACTLLNAQQALWDAPQVESPVLNADGTVTFRYLAPKAVKVTVSGGFSPDPENPDSLRRVRRSRRG